MQLPSQWRTGCQIVQKRSVFTGVQKGYSFLSVEEVVHCRPRCLRYVGSRGAVRLRHGGRCGPLIVQVSWSRAIVLFSAAPAISGVPNPARVAQPVACFTLTSALQTGTRQQAQPKAFWRHENDFLPCLFLANTRFPPSTSQISAFNLSFFSRSSTPSR